MLRWALHWQIMIAMLIGAAGGLAANYFAGERTLAEPVEFFAGQMQPYGFPLPVAIAPGAFWSSDRPEAIRMQIVHIRDERVDVRRVFVGVVDEATAGKPRGGQLADVGFWPEPPRMPREAPREVIAPSLEVLKASDPEAYALFLRYGRSTARRAGDALKMVGDLFLRLLKMVSVPLLIFSLSAGVLGVGAAERLGRMFGRTLAYYVSTSMLAIVVGLAMVNIIRPGVDSRPDVADGAVPAAEQGKSLATVLFEQLETLIPPNPIRAVAEGDFLGIIAFTLAFAVCAVLVGGRTAETVREFAGAGFDVMMKLTMAVVRLAPLGVLCLIFYAAATQGLRVFGQLGWYMLTVLLGLAVHGMIVLPLIVKFVARCSPWQFAKAVSPALFMAFSSASSNATLPLTLASVEKRAGVSNRISSFVLPLGATVNMDGTALYEVVAVLFIANMTPGVDLTLAQQAIVAITALLASIGAAGIPHAGLVMMVIVLQAVGLPTDAQGLIIAVDRLLDMARTSVNVWSDACGCAVVARLEGDAA
jgi:Na+/H+-dicarboxylate symporter